MSIDPQYLSVIVAILIHAFASVWWASQVTATMNFQNKVLESIQKSIQLHEATKYSKEDAAKDFAVRDQQIKAMWHKVDSLGVK